MKLVYLIIFFILGSCMGSFYTVIGMRLPKKEDFIKSKSYCDNCHHNLSLLDMVPILSYILLRGKCRYCHKKIDSLSTFMELFTGILFALAFYVFDISLNFYICLGIISMLSIISVSDMKYYIIPDEVLIFFTGYFLIVNTLFNGVMSSLVQILSGIIMFTFMYIIYRIGNFIFKKESLGGGDIKLMFVIGLIVHPFLGLFVIFLASLIALPISLLILWKRKKNLIPFGPFLLTSFLLVFFTKIDMNQITAFIRSI